MNFQDTGTTNETLNGLIEQVGARDDRLRVLGEELARRTQRLAEVEERLAIEAGIADIGRVPTTYLQVFWPEAGLPSEERSIKRALALDGRTQTLSIELPAALEDMIRIDPGDAPGFWGIDLVEVHGVTADGALTTEPLFKSDATTAFAGVVPARGVVKLSAGSELRLYALDSDPQLTVKIANQLERRAKWGTGAAVLTVKCRALGTVHGFREAEHTLLREVSEALVSPGPRGATSEQAARLQREIAELRLEIRDLAKDLARLDTVTDAAEAVSPPAAAVVLAPPAEVTPVPVRLPATPLPVPPPVVEAPPALAARIKRGLKRRAALLGLRIEDTQPPIDPRIVRLFDEAYYLEHCPEARGTAGGTLAHYLHHGWKHGLNPTALFSTRYYLAKNPDVAAAGVNPLEHFVACGAEEGRSPHALFDVKFYAGAGGPGWLGQYNPLVHYLDHGGKEFRRPHPLFDPRYYLHCNPTARSSALTPLEHYVREGWKIGESACALFDIEYYLRRYPDIAAAGVEPLSHFAEHGTPDRRSPHPLFDTAYYLDRNPDVAREGLNALAHYLMFGRREGRNPHPAFDVRYYLQTNRDVAAADMDPLEHFVEFGFREGRDPSPAFDCAFYLAANPDVAKSGVNPLVHFLQHHPDAFNAKTQAPAPSTTAQPLRLVVLLNTWDEAHRVAFETTSSAFSCEHPDRYQPRPGDYVYAPLTPATCLPAQQLAGVLLTLALTDYDFVLLTHDLKHPEDHTDAASIKIASLAGAVVWSASAWKRRKAGQAPEAGSRGRVIRLLPAPGDELETINLTDVGLGRLMLRGNGEVSVWGETAAGRRAVRRAGVPADLLTRSSSGKPLVLVLPALLAVGGVERNTIEVMRISKHKYDFVVVTNERLRAETGSLHHQAAQHCRFILDLAEFGPPDTFISALAAVRTALRPDLVWVCNGSIWLSEHAAEFREQFAGVPIVDQQVYDIDAGWIAHFSKVPAFKKSDRYIAINSRIRETFIRKHGIPEEKIDLIYPMLDGRRFNGATVANAHDARLRWGLPTGDVRIYAQVGRLTAQKQPLDFLDMVRRAKAVGENAYFVLVGSGELADACDAYIAEHLLADTVKRIEFIEDPSTFYPALSGLVVSSKFEGLPIVVLECLAIGVPVLSTDVGDVRAVLEEYGSGLVVDGFGGEALWTGLQRFSLELTAISGRARESAAAVHTRFSETTIAGQYDRCFEAARLARGYDIRVGAAAGVSVVIPTYNRVDQLRQTVNACVRHSGGVPLEFVIVDDGSRDGTRAYLTELAKTLPNLVQRSVPNAGPGQARNLGASIARHDVVLFMGDDAEPCDDRFFSTHLDLHCRDRSTSLAVLGKMIWPDSPEDDVSFVMQHIQGRGGEQFGYADLRPYSVLDWRFFYTANISVKKRVVADWAEDGFSRRFRFAAWEDAELAYRLWTRPESLRILYVPSSIAYHRHPYTVDQFLSRQVTAGMMARVMADLHPELAGQIIPPAVLRALDTPFTPGDHRDLADHLAMLEGLKAYARLLERQHKIGSVHWHRSLLYGVFEAAYLQGFLTATAKVDANYALAYRRVVELFYQRTQLAFQTEFLGYAAKPDKVVLTGGVFAPSA